MNQEPTLESVRAGLAAGSVQRIVPEGDRYRWEQQWLRENRAVTGVAGRDATALAAQADHDAASAALVRASAETTASALPPLPRTRPQPPGIPPGQAARVDAPAIGVRRTAEAYGAPPSQAQMLRDAPPGLPAQEPPTSTALLAARHRSALKQFALWRSDDEVKIALRLDESAGDAAATVGALRRWLLDMRLKLGTLIVNGELRWQSRPKDNRNSY